MHCVHENVADEILFKYMKKKRLILAMTHNTPKPVDISESAIKSHSYCESVSANIE